MAYWYLYDGGDNTNTSSTSDPSLAANWTNATDDILAVIALTSAGDIVFVASDHTETESAISFTLAFGGVIGNKVKYISVNRTTGAVEAMQDSTGKLECVGRDLNIIGHVWICGMNFVSGDDMYIAANTNGHILLDSCKLSVPDFLYCESSNHEIEIKAINSDILFTTEGTFRLRGGILKIIGGSISSSVAMIATTLFTVISAGCTVILKNVDLSGVYDNTTLITAATERSEVRLTRCKMWAGWTVPDMTTPYSGDVILESCDTGNGYNYFLRVNFYGRTQQDTANHKTLDFSAKMVSSANAKEWTEPLRFKLSEFYATANPTLTVEYIHEAQGSGSGGDLQDDEFWIEIEYPDSTDEALGKLDQSNRASTILATPADQDNSTESWTENLTGEVKQKSEVTISGGAAGIHTVWACLAKPSTTVYVDPDVTVS